MGTSLSPGTGIGKYDREVIHVGVAVSGEIFGHYLSADILVFPSPVDHMLTSSGFALLTWDIFHRFL